VSAALIVYLFRAIDVHELAVQLRSTDGAWLAASGLLGLLGLVARARRWALLFPPGEEPPPLFPAMMIGYMVNNVLPLRAGEVVRVAVAAQRWGHGFWAIVATTIVERLLDSLVIVGVLSALVFMLPVPRYLVGGAITLLVIDVVAIALLVALGLAGCKTEVSTTPTGSSGGSTSSTTVVKEKAPETSPSNTTVVVPSSPTPSTTETTKSTTITTPSGDTANKTTTTTTTNK